MILEKEHKGFGCNQRCHWKNKKALILKCSRKECDEVRKAMARTIFEDSKTGYEKILEIIGMLVLGINVCNISRLLVGNLLILL